MATDNNTASDTDTASTIPIITDESSGTDTSTPSRKQSKNLTNNQRLAIVQDLLQHKRSSSNRALYLAKGALKEAAETYSVSPRTIARVWSRYKKTVDPVTCPAGNVLNRKRGNCGRRPRDLSELELLRNIPHKDRGDL